MKSKSLAGAALVILLAIAAYWYWSPVLALRSLQTAAQNGDAEAFNEHVDYPRLRDSVKGQFSATLAQKLGTEDKSNPLAALGTLIGVALINQMVDAMVRPEFVMAAMNEGRWAKPQPAEQAPTPPSPSPPESPTPSANVKVEKTKARWIVDREGASKMTAYAVDPGKPDEPNADRLGLVFERIGFAGWKLTGIRMPASAR